MAEDEDEEIVLRVLFDSPESRILRHLASQGPIPSQHAFKTICGQSPRLAKALRRQLVAYGWIKEWRPPNPKTTDLGSDITPEGKRVALLLEDLQKAEERARKRAETKP